jgi:hypothetical protein
LAVLRAYTCTGSSYTRAILLRFRDVVVIFTNESWPYTAYVGFCVYPLLPQNELYVPFAPDLVMRRTMHDDKTSVYIIS